MGIVQHISEINRFVSAKIKSALIRQIRVIGVLFLFDG